MSQISNKLANIIKSNFHRKFCHEPGESASSRPSRGVGDSARTIEGQRITNITTGTFSGLNCFAGEQAEYDFSRAGVARARLGRRRCLARNPEQARDSLASLRRRHGARAPHTSVVTCGLPRKTYSCLLSNNRFRHPLMYLASLALMIPAFVTLVNTNNAHATASSINIGITGSPTLNLKTTTDGVFGDSGNATITVTTNHAAGYALTLSASGKNNPTSLDTNGGATSGGTVGFVSLGTKKDNQDVCPSGINATAFNTTDCNGYWGYKPSKYNSVDNTSTNYYYASPTTSGDTLDTTSNANDGSYTVSIGARADTDTAIAEYSNTFVFAVTGNPTPYAITYNANAGTDTVTNMPTNHTTSDTGASGETVTLDATVPVREGYTFKGWCSATTSDDSCSGTTYNPDGDGTNLSLTINQQSATNSYTLYAMWGSSGMTLEQSYAKAGKTKLNGYYKMQDMAGSTICADTTVIPSELQVIDTRDKKVYWIAKLADDHCWMTQNLDLDLSTGTELKHADTDLGWGTDTATTTWTPARDTIDATGGTISGWTNSGTAPYSVNPGDWYWKGKTFYASSECSSNACRYIDKSGAKYATYFSEESSDDTNGSHGHVGNYYNWSAAVASNSTSSYTSNTSTNIANNPQNSICPAGWRLPTVYGTTTSNASTTNDAKNEFYTLNRLYNSSSTSTSQKLEASPLFLVRAGYVSGGSLRNAGYLANYWSSTVSDSSLAYSLDLYSTNVYPAFYNSRFNGFSVRCLVR